MSEEIPKTIKYRSNTVGIGAGNAVAYFFLEYLKAYKEVVFADPVVAMAMAGALVSVLFIQLDKIGTGLKYVFDRIFPAKKNKES